MRSTSSQRYNNNKEKIKTCIEYLAINDIDIIFNQIELFSFTVNSIDNSR